MYLAAAYDEHAESYYRDADSEPTDEANNVRDALRPLIRLYGDTAASTFGPRGLKAVREKMIELGWCWNTVNRQVSRIKTMFRWAVEQELIPGSVHHALLAVKHLKFGRSEARESQPVRPVAEAVVNAIKPHVSREVWAMVQLQFGWKF